MNYKYTYLVQDSEGNESKHTLVQYPSFSAIESHIRQKHAPNRVCIIKIECLDVPFPKAEPLVQAKVVKKAIRS